MLTLYCDWLGLIQPVNGKRGKYVTHPRPLCLRLSCRLGAAEDATSTRGRGLMAKATWKLGELLMQHRKGLHAAAGIAK